MKRPVAVLAITLCLGTTAPALSAPAKHPAAARSEDALEAPTCDTCEGVHMLEAGRFSDAKRIFDRQAARGDPEAQYNLGWMYHHGRGVAVDYAKARDLYFKAGQGSAEQRGADRAAARP